VFVVVVVVVVVVMREEGDDEIIRSVVLLRVFGPIINGTFDIIGIDIVIGTHATDLR